MAERRRDKKGRILRKGELQRSDGRYMYRYTNMSGERQVEYSWRLVESDPQPQGRKKELSLREKEALIEQDRFDMISTSHGSMTVNELFDFYVAMRRRRGKITVRTVENYTKVWNKNMRKRNFAGMSIQAVRKTHILDCYQEMQEDGVGNGSITLIHKVLPAMFNHAVSEDYIRRNYAYGCTKELDNYNNKIKSPNLTKLSHYSHGRVTWECYAIEELKEMVGNRHKSWHSLPPEKGEQYGNYTGRAFVQGLWKGRE